MFILIFCLLLLSGIAGLFTCILIAQDVDAWFGWLLAFGTIFLLTTSGYFLGFLIHARP